MVEICCKCSRIMGDDKAGAENKGKLPPANFFKHEGKYYCSDCLMRLDPKQEYRRSWI